MVLVVRELLMEEFVNNAGDIGTLTILCLDPDLVPPWTLDFIAGNSKISKFFEFF